MPADPTRILIIARDMVGDLVNTTGAVLRVRERFPDAHIVLEGGPASQSLFPGCEVWIRERHRGALGKLARIRQYHAGRFDLGLIFDDSREKIRLASFGGVRRVVGVARSKSDLLSAQPKEESLQKSGMPKPLVIPFDPKGHDLFDSLRAVLDAIGAETDVAPSLPIEEKHRTRALGLMERPLIGLHVGASDLAKQWPEDQWISLASALGDRAVILAGPGEEELRTRIAVASGRASLPTLDLLDYAAVVERMEVIVTGDTASAHLAGAVGTRAVVLYGPTDPAQFHPWGSNWKSLRQDLGCEHYGGGCAFKVGGRCTQKCMAEIHVREVLQALE